MSNFSIRKSLYYAVKTYLNHFILFLSIGTILGVANWAGVVAPRLLAQRLGVYKPLVVKYKPDLPTQQFRSNTGLSGALNQFAYGAGMALAKKAIEHIKDASNLSLFIIFLLWSFLWLFSAFLSLGFVQVTLDIKDMNISSTDRLFSVWNFFPSYVGASFFLGLLSLAVGIGFIVVGSAFGALIASVFIALFKISSFSYVIVSAFAIISFVAVILFLLRYVFYGYCLLDKETTVLGALSCSRELTHGSIQKLTFFFVVLHTIIYGLMKIVGLGTGYSLGKAQTEFTLMSLVHVVLITIIVVPLSGLALVYVYRQLSNT